MKIDAVMLKRYLSPNAYKDLDSFIEQLPVRAGKGIIIAGVCAWIAAGLAVLYVTMQANHIMALRADILKAESLKPTVPVISKIAVDQAEIKAFATRLTELYPQIAITAQGSRIEIRGTSTDKYGAFREAVGHMFNGGKGWRVTVEQMCVGRECANNLKLFGAFTINRLRVDKPTV